MTEIITIALTVYGLSAVFDEGMIFQKVGDYLESKLPHWLYMPLVGCSICMTPWYGALICLFMHWPIWYVIPAMGLNAMIVHLKRD